MTAPTEIKGEIVFRYPEKKDGTPPVIQFTIMTLNGLVSGVDVKAQGTMSPFQLERVHELSGAAFAYIKEHLKS